MQRWIRYSMSSVWMEYEFIMRGMIAGGERQNVSHTPC
jgi:hypothetical protein